MVAGTPHRGHSNPDEGTLESAHPDFLSSLSSHPTLPASVRGMALTLRRYLNLIRRSVQYLYPALAGMHPHIL